MFLLCRLCEEFNSLFLHLFTIIYPFIIVIFLRMTFPLFLSYKPKEPLISNYYSLSRRQNTNQDESLYLAAALYMSYANNAATSEMFFEVKAFTTICKSYHNDLPFILNSTQPISLCSIASIPKLLLTLSKPFISFSPFFSIKLNQTKYIYILFFSFCLF